LQDQELLSKFRNPETKHLAFNTLVQQYQKRVYWLIRKLVIDHDDANDLSQDVFVKIWNVLDDFHGDSALFTWVYRIATNQALAHLRSKRNRFFLPLHDVEAELNQKLSANLDVDTSDWAFQLQKAILKLPEKQRVVFNLRYFEELSYKEIAEITQSKEGALKTNYHLAAKKIEAILKTELNLS